MTRPRARWWLPLLVAVVPATLHAEKPAGEESRRTIAVTGHGEVKQRPDRVHLAFAVETTAATAAEAAAANAKRGTAVTAALKAELAPGDTLLTTGYAIEPRYDMPRPGEQHEPHITGYVVRNEVQVQSQKVDGAGKMIDAATAAGANRVSGVQFLLANRGEAQRAAIQEAAGDARAQAESMAKGLGVQLGRVLSATTQSEPIISPRRFEAMAMRAEAMPATPIEAGDLTVPATVQVSYEIE